MNVNIMTIMGRLRRQIVGEVFDYQTLLTVLSDYRKPRDKISGLLRQRAIIRVKKGLYCFGDDFSRQPVSRELLANLIYGPSYVSLDYALSFHGLIPERVEILTSVTVCRSKNFDTPIGGYSYRMLTEDRYSVGADLGLSDKVPFLVATPEKALVDKVWTDKRFSGLRVSDFEQYLSEDLRIEFAKLRNLDKVRLHSIVIAYDSAKIYNLMRFLKRLEGAYNA